MTEQARANSARMQQPWHFWSPGLYVTLPAGAAEARSSSELCYKACAATVFGAVQMAVVHSVPLPRCSTPVMQRGTPTNRSNHTRHFPGGYDLFYIIDVTGNRAKIPPPGSQRGDNQENYLYQRSGAESGRDLPGSGWNHTGSGHGSQADLVVGPIEDGEILADEDITQDPEVPGGGGDVHALEPAGADVVALEERRIKPELGRRPFGDRRWGLSIQDHGALPATRKEELPASCLGTWLFLAWGLPL